MSALEAKESGSSAWSEGKYLDAAGHFSTAIDRARNDSEMLKLLYSNRSACYAKLNRSSEALEDANQCLRYDSSWTKGLLRKADALMQLRRFHEALEILEPLSQSSPSDSSIASKLQKVRASIHYQAQSNPFTVPVAESRLSGGPYDFSDSYSTIRTYVRLAVVAFGVGYVIPVRAISSRCHFFFLVAAVINYVMYLFKSFGMPRFNKEYAQLILPDMCTQLLFLAVLQFSVHPYYLAMMPILLGELGHAVPFGMRELEKRSPQTVEQFTSMISQHLPQSLGMTREQWMGMPPNSKWDIFATVINQMSATCEVMQMIFLVMELFMPTRNFIFCYLWYQYLTMRYLQDRNGCLKGALRNLDNQVNTILSYSFVPAIVRTGYMGLKSFLSRQVPTPGQGAPSVIPKGCTIM